jgi:antitoxin StbD
MKSPSTQPVLTTRDAREQLPRIVAGFRAAGASAQPVVLGAHRRPEAVLVPVELFEVLAPLIEDLEIAQKLAARYREDDGSRLSFDDVATAAGFDPAEFS